MGEREVEEGWGLGEGGGGEWKRVRCRGPGVNGRY